ncbi:uncharacterized protein LOC130671051 [Microplitis mediator]|uniref:uncharacterized protein LOC130671051 n=1 Tax=Microplitis mediator TaxID=375433 RepID=UPI0025555284|nr:uncharacterized protein LOC130671051 [Microplitis mediator]
MNCPDKSENEIQEPCNPETKIFTGANNLNENKKSEKYSSLKISEIEEKSTIESDQSDIKTAQIRSYLIENAANAAAMRIKASKLLAKAEMYATEAQTKAQTALEKINSAVSLLEKGKLDLVEKELDNALGPADDAITAAQAFISEKNSINSVVIDEIPADFATDSDLKSIKSKADDNAVEVNNAIKTINLKEASVSTSKSAAEKAKAAVPLLRSAAKVAIELKKADTVLSNANQAEDQSKSASEIIKSATSLLESGELDLVENKAQEADSLARAAIEAAQNFTKDKNSINSVDIAEVPADFATDEDLKSIKSKADDNAVEVNNAIKTINLKEASVSTSKSAAEKAKAAVPLLRSAAKVAIELKKANAVLSNANQAEDQSKSASKIIESATSLLEQGELDLVENKAQEAVSPARAAIEAAQNFNKDKNSINSVDIAEVPADFATDSDLKSIKTKADANAVKVNNAIETINLKKESVSTSKSAAEKAKAAVPLLRSAAKVAIELKKAGAVLSNANQAEDQSKLASKIIESATSLLKQGELDLVENKAQEADSLARAAIEAAQNFTKDKNSINSVDIAEVPADFATDEDLKSIKKKADANAVEVNNAIETINLKKESVSTSKSAAEKAKAAVPLLRSAAKVAIELKKAGAVLSNANQAEDQSKSASEIIKSATSLLEPGELDLVENKAQEADSLARAAIEAAQNFTKDKNSINSVDIAEVPADFATDEDLKSIKTKADANAVKVNNAIQTINLKEKSVSTSKSAAEKAKAAVPLLRSAVKVAIQRKNAGDFFSRAKKSAVNIAEHAQQAETAALEAKNYWGKSMTEQASWQADMASNLALSARADAGRFRSGKKFVDRAATNARKLELLISSEFTDIKKIANELASAAEKDSEKLVELEKSVKTDMLRTETAKNDGSKYMDS